MKALWKSAGGLLQFREIDEPQIAESDDVKIKVSYGTIGMENMRMTREGDIYSKAGVAGYEMMGVISDLGEQAKREGFAVGQRVSGAPVLFCGSCEFCKRGKQIHCINLKYGGGTLCEYIVWKSKQLVHIRENTSDRLACLIEPVAVMLEAVEKLRPELGSAICIFGADFNGLVLLQLLKKRGVGSVTVVEREPYLRELARSHGADHVLDPEQSSCVAQLYQITDFNGFDAIADTSGDPAMLDIALNLMIRGGILLLTTYYEYGRKIAVNSMNFIVHNLTIASSFLYSNDKLELAASILPRLKLEELVQKEYAFEDAIRAYQEKKEFHYPRVVIRV